MCIKGHAVNDPFGICWECARLKQEARGQRARMHPRSRPWARAEQATARVKCPRPESNQRTRFRKRRASLRKLLQAPDF
jgi:hypothetical protein